jgi:hypothetical protein
MAVWTVTLSFILSEINISDTYDRRLSQWHALIIVIETLPSSKIVAFEGVQPRSVVFGHQLSNVKLHRGIQMNILYNLQSDSDI